MYWIFIYNNSQLVCGQTSNASIFRNTCAPGQGREGNKQETQPPGNSSQKAHASLPGSKANLTHTKYMGSWLSQETFSCALKVPIREQEVNSRCLRKQFRRGKGSGLARGDNPVLYRNTFCVMSTRQRTAKAILKVQLGITRVKGPRGYNCLR